MLNLRIMLLKKNKMISLFSNNHLFLTLLSMIIYLYQEFIIFFIFCIF